MLWPGRTLKSKEQIKTKISEASHRKQTSTLLILVLLDYVQNIQAAWSVAWCQVQIDTDKCTSKFPQTASHMNLSQQKYQANPWLYFLRVIGTWVWPKQRIIISSHTLHIYMFKTNHLFASLFRRLFAVMGVAPVNRKNFLVRSGLGQVVPCQGSWKPTATWPTNPKMPPLHKAISGATYRWIWDTKIQHHVLIFWESWRISLRGHLDALGYFRLLALDYEARTNCAGRLQFGKTLSGWN